VFALGVALAFGRSPKNAKQAAKAGGAIPPGHH
jgi:hypothetical protein